MIGLLKKLGSVAWNSVIAVVSNKTKFPAVNERDLQDFASYVQKNTATKAHYQVSGKFMEYGTTPRRFLLTVEANNTILMSFFLCGEPTFSAVTFALARDFFGKERTFLSSSFLYREDSTVCLNWHTDFPVVYLEYINKILRSSRSVKSSTELN
jgi:hypothetical protein